MKNYILTSAKGNEQKRKPAKPPKSPNPRMTRYATRRRDKKKPSMNSTFVLQAAFKGKLTLLFTKIVTPP